MSSQSRPERKSLVVLISGSGSNLQAIIDATQDPSYPAHISAVISNKADVKGLLRAQQAGIATEVLSHNAFPDRDSYDKQLATLIDAYQPDLVVLAGFMRILTEGFVNHFSGRMLNIHPSLLPRYKGLNTHQQAIDNGDSVHGATVHFVTPDLDSGPLIIQASVPVSADDNADSLASRVLENEHLIYPKAIAWVATGRISMKNGIVCDNGTPLEAPIQFQANSLTG